MGISSQRISYAIGTSAWGAKAAQEGLPLLEHVEPEAVIDTPIAPRTAQPHRLPEGQDVQIGPLYYVAPIQTLFSPAHSILLLDKFFERTAIGAAPYYDRTYTAEDILNDPITPFVNLWKKTAKVGVDENLCCSDGIVTGIEFAKEPNSPFKLIAHCAFASRDMAAADPGHWMIDFTHGNYAPIKDSEILFYISQPGSRGTIPFKIHTFHVNLSTEFTPHYWGTQNPDRFSRGHIGLSGDISLRDITNEVRAFTAWFEESTTKSATIILGAYSEMKLNFNFANAVASEDEITRTGKFNFTGVYESASMAPTGFQLYVRPGRAYIP